MVFALSGVHYGECTRLFDRKPYLFLRSSSASSPRVRHSSGVYRCRSHGGLTIFSSNAHTLIFSLLPHRLSDQRYHQHYELLSDCDQRGRSILFESCLKMPTMLSSVVPYRTGNGIKIARECSVPQRVQIGSRRKSRGENLTMFLSGRRLL